MEHFRLRVFEAVWTTGSYTKAARQLGLTQPAVSQNIAELEKELGTVLFERASVSSTAFASSGDDGSVRGGKMCPTPAAEVFIKWVRRVLKDYDNIRILFNPEMAEYGTVRIRVDRSAAEYVLPKILDTLKATHPSIDFEVLSSESPETNGVSLPDEPPADVLITTVPVEQDGVISLRFEAFGPATPFVEAVRLILSKGNL